MSIFLYTKYNKLKGVTLMYYGYPSYGYGYDGMNGGLWIIIIVLIIFFVLFWGNNNCGNNHGNCR